MKTFVRFLFTCSLISGTTVGCASLGVPSGSKPVSKADIAAVEVTLTAAVNAANACLVLTVGPCTAPTVRQQIIRDIHDAHDSFKQVQSDNAKGMSVSLTAVNQILSRLVFETPSISSAK